MLGSTTSFEIEGTNDGFCIIFPVLTGKLGGRVVRSLVGAIGCEEREGKGGGGKGGRGSGGEFDLILIASE